VKSAHRFDYVRFGEALVERGLIDREVLNHVMRQVQSTRALLPEVLVRENLVSDWEVSRIACELYHLPFLSLDQYAPAAGALDGYDLSYLLHYALVPLDRFGALVTVVMPGLVSSEVIEGMRSAQGGRVLPVVGSVLSNRRWLSENVAPKGPVAAAGPLPGLPGARPKGPLPAKAAQAIQELDLVDDGDWGGVFDAGDEAVQLDLKTPTRKRP